MPTQGDRAISRSAWHPHLGAPAARERRTAAARPAPRRRRESRATDAGPHRTATGVVLIIVETQVDDGERMPRPSAVACPRVSDHVRSSAALSSRGSVAAGRPLRAARPPGRARAFRGRGRACRARARSTRRCARRRTRRNRPPGRGEFDVGGLPSASTRSASPTMSGSGAGRPIDRDTRATTGTGPSGVRSIHAMPEGSASGIHRTCPLNTAPRGWIGRGVAQSPSDRERCAQNRAERSRHGSRRGTGDAGARGHRAIAPHRARSAEGVARHYCEGP